MLALLYCLFSSKLKRLKSGEHASAFELASKLDQRAQAKIHLLHLNLFELSQEPPQKMGVTLSVKTLHLLSGVLRSAMASKSKTRPHELAEMTALFVLGGFRALPEQPKKKIVSKAFMDSFSLLF